MEKQTILKLFRIAELQLKLTYLKRSINIYIIYTLLRINLIVVNLLTF